MPEVQNLIRITTDASKPIEEIKACIIELCKPHVGKQLEILQQVDLWLGETIVQIEQNVAIAQKEEAKPDDPGGSS